MKCVAVMRSERSVALIGAVGMREDRVLRSTHYVLFFEKADFSRLGLLGLSCGVPPRLPFCCMRRW